eukprot:566234-Prymnesium_polylepis.1
MPAAVSQPLSSSARPGGLADGRVGRHGVASRVSRSYWCVKRLTLCVKWLTIMRIYRRDALGNVQFVCTRGRRCFPISRDLLCYAALG